MYDESLDVLSVIADTGSFKKAGEQLYMTDVSVRNKINALEQRLGIKLLNRSHSGVTLTPAGKIINESSIILKKDAEYILRMAHFIETENII